MSWNKLGPLFLKNEEGKTLEFKTPYEFAMFVHIKGIATSIGDEPINQYTVDGRIDYFNPHVYHVIDECGMIVPEWKIDEILDHHQPVKRLHARQYDWRLTYIGRKGYGRHDKTPYRKSKVHQERKDNNFVDFDEDCKLVGIEPRLGRPNVRGGNCVVWGWARREETDRNWKNFRKEKWRPLL